MKSFACAILLLAAAIASAEQPEIAGVGARPLSDTLASSWFVRSVDPSRDTYEMALLVFLVGDPGWVREKTEWTWSASDPGYSQFVVKGVPLRIELAAGRVKVLDYDAPLAHGNVLVVTGLGTAAMRVSHTESLDLAVPFESDSLRVVVSRSRTLREVLGLAEPAAR